MSKTCTVKVIILWIAFAACFYGAQKVMKKSKIVPQESAYRMTRNLAHKKTLRMRGFCCGLFRDLLNFLQTNFLPRPANKTLSRLKSHEKVMKLSKILPLENAYILSVKITSKLYTMTFADSHFLVSAQKILIWQDGY